MVDDASDDAGRADPGRPRRAASDRRLATDRLVWIAAIIGIAGFGLSLLYLKIAENVQTGPTAGLESVVLLLAGVAVVTLLLYLGTAIVRALDLGSPTEALGMPQGSIRALIAIMLILIFVVIGLVVFGKATAGEAHDSHGITQAQIDKLRLDGSAILSQDLAATQPNPSGEPVYDVKSVSGMTADAHDFGLQLLSTVITLVVAVSGFYFGAQTVSQAGRETREQLGWIQGARARIRAEVIGTQPEPPGAAPPEDKGDEPEIAEVESVDDGEVGSEPVAAPEAKSDPEPVAQPEVTADPEPVAQPEVTADPEPVAEPEVTADPEPVAEPEVKADPEPGV
jgi:hypothetical protein